MRIWPLILIGFLALPQPLKVKEGISNLLEGYPRWGFQVRGEEPRYMPPYWYGRFEETGADCYPQMREGELTPWFFHPPWRDVRGETFAEWELSLPNLKPITLQLKLALASGALPASDGVIFKLLLTNKGEEKEIARFSSRSEEWEERRIDLSPFAGEDILLKLVVNPGEKWDTTNDWARVGELKLIVGKEEEARKKEERERSVERERLMERYGPATGSVNRFWGIGAKTPLPSCGAIYENRIKENADGSYELLYEGRDCQIKYIFTPPFSSLTNLRVIYNGREIPNPTFMGGVSLVLNGEVVDWSREDVKREHDVKAKDKGLEEWESWEYKGESGEIKIEVSIKGKSLELLFSSEKPIVNAINIAVLPFRRISIPFLYEGQAQVAYVEPLFLSSFCDWWETEASTIGASGSSPTYIPKTNGERNTPREIFYLTASPYLEEVLPNIPNPASPYLGELSQRLVLDIWGGKFADDRKFLQELERYGIDNLLVIKHDWQREGYDNAYPTTMPANKALGGDEELRKLSEEAKRIGHRFCVHENYYDYYPNSEAFRSEDVALDPQGNPLLSWYNPSVPIQALVLKPSKFLYYEKIFSPEIKRRYGVNAGYFDIMPCWTVVDYDAKAPGAAKVSYTHKVNRDAYAFLRETYKGPVVCEASDFREAGYYDGGSNYGFYRREIPMLPIFELLKVHPLMLNHGMGYYERWSKDVRNDPLWYQRVMTEEERDEYRIMTFAFGRIGFLGRQLVATATIPALAKEYFLTLPVQKRYGTSLPRRILYEVAGKWVSTSGAVLLGKMDRLFLEYTNGLKLYLNRDKEDWRMRGFLLPRYGFLAQGAGLLAYTAKKEGVIVDYAEDESGIFCDARSETCTPPFKRIFPSISLFKDLGGGVFQISYRWRVEDTPGGDFVAFVHFLNPRENKIAFQQDHVLPLPTDRWKKDMTVEDGPYTLQVPPDAEGIYPLYLGLYNKEGRVVLGNGKDSFPVGKLEVVRMGDEVSLRFQPEVGEDFMAKYLTRVNKQRKKIDFGKVVTDGCLRVEKSEGKLKVIPLYSEREYFVGLRLGYFKKDWKREDISVIAFGKDGEERGKIEAQLQGELLFFRTKPDVGFYEVRY